MSMPWDNGLLYLYPPLSFVARTLAKIRREEAEVIAILPYWPNRGWFPLILEMLVELPIRLPQTPSLLTGPDGDVYPDLSSLRLAAWRLSGKLYRQKEFLHRLQKLWHLPLDVRLGSFINENGTFLLAGAREGVSIPFIALP
jgi:hypothetical protein